MHRMTEIPTAFHSLFHAGPFRNCSSCECDLLDGSCDYFIERCFRGDEPIFEIAMCESCRATFEKELSLDSRMRISAHIEERLDVEMRLEATASIPADTIDPWIDTCILSKRPRRDCKQYQIVAFCNGSQMYAGVFPFMISDSAADDLQKLMSKKTRDRHDEMVQDLFGLPSEFADTPLLF